MQLASSPAYFIEHVNPVALYHAPTNRSYFCYLQNAEVKANYYDHASGVTGTAVTVYTYTGGADPNGSGLGQTDIHGCPSMCIFGDKLYIFFALHESPLRVRRTNAVLTGMSGATFSNAANWENPLGGTNYIAQYASYPQPLVVGSKIVLFYRNQGTNQWYEVFTSSTDGATWAAPTTLIHPNVLNEVVYSDADALGDEIHVIWGWNVYLGAWYPQMYHLWSEDAGATWKTYKDGSVQTLTLPATPANCGAIFDGGTGRAFLCSVAMAGAGDMRCSFYLDDMAGNRDTYYQRVLNGVVTAENQWVASYYAVINPNDVARLALVNGAKYETDIEIHSTANNGDTFTKERDVTTYSAGSWDGEAGVTWVDGAWDTMVLYGHSTQAINESTWAPGNASLLGFVLERRFDLAGEVIPNFIELDTGSDAGAGGETAQPAVVSPLTGQEAGSSGDTGLLERLVPLTAVVDEGQAQDAGALADTIYPLLFDLAGEVLSAAVALDPGPETGIGGDGGSLVLVRTLVAGRDSGQGADTGPLNPSTQGVAVGRITLTGSFRKGIAVSGRFDVAESLTGSL